MLHCIRLKTVKYSSRFRRPSFEVRIFVHAIPLLFSFFTACQIQLSLRSPRTSLRTVLHLHQPTLLRLVTPLLLRMVTRLLVHRPRLQQSSPVFISTPPGLHGSSVGMDSGSKANTMYVHSSRTDRFFSDSGQPSLPQRPLPLQAGTVGPSAAQVRVHEAGVTCRLIYNVVLQLPALVRHFQRSPWSIGLQPCLSGANRSGSLPLTPRRR
jgi:hypothetical protein